MPHVPRGTFKGTVHLDYFECVIPSPYVKDDFKLAKALSTIFDGDGISREYHCWEVDLKYYAITSWEQKDLLPELQAMEDSGVRQGSLKDIEKALKEEMKGQEDAQKA
ncbi:hypothetical protein ACKRZS_013217 [Fusarium odoratissimum]|uniref:Uncharacterized protein n=2 Tax=Fusarium oxysporum species complex TaxID=171631 RepID=X0KL84_FUSO5|nr:uncharacterized protein FOIG_09954 [Fusarium odoratissimum NRRL 54006]EXL97629.1 hypothetical protein FOIG_09954 [Fusarium odoratissimum NRRL 54006]KAH7216171.1 hypothetical protein DER44DRAFT_741718 [Fusarium oxysporum]KAK2122604.1 hypothetical protein NOF04DRAFT_6820 [Fusarium oxysporum II5]TXB97622.1 hypothetical protein FocTR4_00011161 [Fusarium oxysporum f. sp. cubense]